jgi:hypothetical protein
MSESRVRASLGRAEQHVVGLEVAMHEMRAMRGGEPGARFAHHAHDLAPRPRLLLQPLAQRLALDELHRDEHAVAGQRADVVHRDDVRMRQPRERLRFAQQPRFLRAGRAGRAGLQQLDRDLAIELGIVAVVDHAHAAFAEHVEHDVAADERAARQILDLRRRGEIRRVRRRRLALGGRGARRAFAVRHVGARARGALATGDVGAGARRTFAPGFGALGVVLDGHAAAGPPQASHS